jgi:hypothetical protein
MEQLKWWADYLRILFACLPAFLPANFKEQAGRSQGFHNHVRNPRDGRSRSCFHAGLLALPTEARILCLDSL